jgi:hypothetical protein
MNLVCNTYQLQIIKHAEGMTLVAETYDAQRRRTGGGGKMSRTELRNMPANQYLAYIICVFRKTVKTSQIRSAIYLERKCHKPVCELLLEHS